jgi:DNA-directed RNA polymerase specialized sigma24 family protein
MPKSLRELPAEAREGDRDAISMLLMDYVPRAWQRLAGRLPERWPGLLDENEVLQRVYLNAYRQLTWFTPNEDDPEGSFLTWLTRVAQGTVQSVIREHLRFRRPPAVPAATGALGKSR